MQLPAMDFVSDIMKYSILVNRFLVLFHVLRFEETLLGVINFKVD